MRVLLRKLYFILAIILPNILFAAISVTPQIVYLKNNEPSRVDISVSNMGDKKSYVEVTATEILSPGIKDKESREIIDFNKSKDLIITPQKLALEPGAKKRVRISYLKQRGDIERNFQIDFKPVVGKYKMLSPNRKKGYKSLGVKVMVGYAVKIFVSPKKVNDTVALKRTGKKLFLENKGNVNVSFQHWKICLSEDKCEKLKYFIRLYPGNTEEYTLPYSGKLKSLAKSVKGQKNINVD